MTLLILWCCALQWRSSSWRPRSRRSRCRVSPTRRRRPQRRLSAPPPRRNGRPPLEETGFCFSFLGIKVGWWNYHLQTLFPPNHLLHTLIIIATRFFTFRQFYFDSISTRVCSSWKLSSNVCKNVLIQYFQADQLGLLLQLALSFLSCFLQYLFSWKRSLN